MLENPVAFVVLYFSQDKNEAWPACKGVLFSLKFYNCLSNPKGASLLQNVVITVITKVTDHRNKFNG